MRRRKYILRPYGAGWHNAHGQSPAYRPGPQSDSKNLVTAATSIPLGHWGTVAAVHAMALPSLFSEKPQMPLHNLFHCPAHPHIRMLAFSSSIVLAPGHHRCNCRAGQRIMKALVCCQSLSCRGKFCAQQISAPKAFMTVIPMPIR